MSPHTGMLAVCAVLAIGGIGLIVVGLTVDTAGRSICVLGCVAIFAALVGALGDNEEKK